MGPPLVTVTGWPPRRLAIDPGSGERSIIPPGTGHDEEEAPDKGTTGVPVWPSCAKCRTVRYCCTEHQKAAWKLGHKHSCCVKPLPTPAIVASADAEELLGILREFGTAHGGLASLCAMKLCKMQADGASLSQDHESAIRKVSDKFNLEPMLDILRGDEKAH